MDGLYPPGKDRWRSPLPCIGWKLWPLTKLSDLSGVGAIYFYHGVSHPTRMNVEKILLCFFSLGNLCFHSGNLRSHFNRNMFMAEWRCEETCEIWQRKHDLQLTWKPDDVPSLKLIKTLAEGGQPNWSHTLEQKYDSWLKQCYHFQYPNTKKCMVHLHSPQSYPVGKYIPYQLRIWDRNTSLFRLHLYDQKSSGPNLNIPRQMAGVQRPRRRTNQGCWRYS